MNKLLVVLFLVSAAFCFFVKEGSQIPRPVTMWVTIALFGMAGAPSAT